MFIQKAIRKLKWESRRLIRESKAISYRAAKNRFRKQCVELSKLVPEPVFVKIGANDGITNDPCSDILLANANWKGLLVEPVPYCFERLKKNFSDPNRFTLEQAAIGSAPGVKPFYYLDPDARKALPDLPVWFDHLASFDRNHILKHYPELDPFILQRDTEVTTLASVLQKHAVEKFHLLHIDTEGYDYEVLKTLDFEQNAPIMTLIEYKHLPAAERESMLKLLKKYGYSIHDCGDDYFAINSEAAKRLKWRR
jgi:FkbM family methyltransferase